MTTLSSRQAALSIRASALESPSPRLGSIPHAIETTLASGLICSSSTVGHRPPTIGKRLSLCSQTSFGTDYGLLITLQKLDDGTSRCELSFAPDANYAEIHPNAYAPANMRRMRKLGGGGSGVAVFEGNHPELGDIVMKHGGDKDLKELFALATIAEELKERGRQHPQAALDLQSKIPEFRLIYVSPHHLGEKRRELWYRLRHMYKYSSRDLMVLEEEEEEEKEEEEAKKGVDELPSLQEEEGEEEGEEELENTIALKTRRKHHFKIPHVSSRNGLNMSESGRITGHRDIALYRTTEDNGSSVALLRDSLILSIPPCEKVGDGLLESIVIPGDGYTALKAIVADLNKLMTDQKWKFTLGQKRIGGNNPKTGNQWLYAGKLEGKLLDNLITQNIQLVNCLVTLTSEEERSPKHIRAVQEEIVRFEEDEDITPGDISALSDNFVGNAIKKNFEEGTGRGPILTHHGRRFRAYCQENPRLKKLRSTFSDLSSEDNSIHDLDEEEENLVLLPEEEIPAYHLGSLTLSGALMRDTFEKMLLQTTVWGMTRFYWRTVLRAAVFPRSDHCMAITRIWTCGLTDAGVHNLFLTEDSLWLFDLGQPQLYSAPGFLTKFLFSFFHTLGMEETAEGDWVRRFEHNPISNKLVPTPETEYLLAKAYDAFDITLERLIAELFDGDDGLRWLLIQYVTLQLVSDASFCLERWTIKGGGRTRDANHQKGIEKWLWRALWDLYVSFDINTNEAWTRLDVVHPSHRDSMFFAEMRDLIFDADNRAELQKNGEETDEKESVVDDRD